MLEAIIGIYPHERVAKQPLLIDLDLFIDINLAASSGLLKHSVDYDLVIKCLSEFVDQSDFELLETFAEHLAEMILAKFPITRIICTVCKPKAVNNARSVGISIERKKKK